jgi:hypothetical protein
MGFQRLTNMADVDVDMFCDAERQHIKEGFVYVPLPAVVYLRICSTIRRLVLVEEEQGTHFNLRLPRTAVQLLYGRQVPTDNGLLCPLFMLVFAA